MEINFNSFILNNRYFCLFFVAELPVLVYTKNEINIYLEIRKRKRKNKNFSFKKQTPYYINFQNYSISNTEKIKIIKQKIIKEYM